MCAATEGKTKSFRLNKAIKTLIAFTLLSISLVVAILSGGADSSMVSDISKEYVVNVANSGNVGGSVVSYIVESNDPDEHPLPDSVKECRAIDNILGYSNYSYGSVYNADKEHTVVSTELPDSPNFSILYAKVFSNKESGGLYKHEYFMTRLMFEGYHIRGGAYAFIYLSQTHADELLEIRGYEEQGEWGYTE